MEMSFQLEPGLLRDLKEAKSDLARHGIVILRMIETDLEPAIMTQTRASLSSSPGRLSRFEEEELDKLMEKVRKTAMKSSSELVKLYTRLLATIGTEFLGDLVKELEGIGELFKWDRIARTVEPVNSLIVEKGFPPIELTDPDEVSEAFGVELGEKWPAAFGRFRELADKAAAQLTVLAEREKQHPTIAKQKKTVKKR